MKKQHGFYGRNNRYTAMCYLDMIRRCRNPKNASYANYGAKGITVCERWLGPDGIKNFMSDMGTRPVGMSLDRIDNTKGYFPENCRWATIAQQNNNRGSYNRTVEFNGTKKTVGQLASEYGIEYRVLWDRLFRKRQKMTVSEALGLNSASA